MKVFLFFFASVCVVGFINGIDRQMARMRAFQRKNAYKKHTIHRPQYHITAPRGWLNEPSGFTYFRKKYHIFYQYHPYEGSWGPTRWGHAVSSNLLHWNHYPPVLIPKEHYDKHGCLSGTSYRFHGHLNIFYTGIVRELNTTRETQNVAISADGITFHKYIYNPVLTSPTESYPFRNPKVWFRYNTWYMMVGNTNFEDRGRLLLYTSHDRFQWKLNGSLSESYGDAGYLWENPDMLQIDGYYILILSIQGLDKGAERFKNFYQSVYLIGDFNYATASFENLEVSTQTIKKLDHGHDFYAAKTMKSPDGRNLLVAWLGMWGSRLPEALEGWAGMLTIIREIRLHPYDEGRLLITPIDEMTLLRSELLERAWYRPGEMFSADSKSFELLVNSTHPNDDLTVTLQWKEGEYKIWYSAKRRIVSVDRGGEDGFRRAGWTPSGAFSIRIFVDVSSVEVFCGDGEVVFSSRIYPRKMIIVIGGDEQVHITQYQMTRSVGFASTMNVLSKRIDLSGYAGFPKPY